MTVFILKKAGNARRGADDIKRKAICMQRYINGLKWALIATVTAVI